MSYAHEIFGVRETRHDIWMQDLLIAGTASTTFNSDRMREIAASPFVKDNGFAGYYMVLWCKYNNVPLNEIMRVGQRLTLTNSDYGTTDDYILTSISTTAAHFLSARYVAYMPAIPTDSTYYDGNWQNSYIGAWLKAETPNWHSAMAAGATGMSAMIGEYGYSHGIPEEFRDILAQNTANPAFVHPFISDEPFTLYNTGYTLGVRNEFGNTAIKTAKIVTNGKLDSKIRIGGAFWSAILPTGSTETNASPQHGSAWLETPTQIASLANTNAGCYTYVPTGGTTPASSPKLIHLTGHLARFAVEF